jgi:putative ABC transport system substrate-binding protein
MAGINRRIFLGMMGVGVLIAPLAAETQPVKGAHIGFLPGGAGAAHRQQLEALREGLRELGYVEGRTITITALWPKTPSELPELAAALVKQNVALVVAPPSDAVRAVKRASATMPIVFAAVADPVGSGFVVSLARPGGNITGLSQLNVELSGKRVELLHELFPSRRAVMLGLAPDDTPALAPGDTIIQETERRARALGPSRCGSSRCPGWRILSRPSADSIPSGTAG